MKSLRSPERGLKLPQVRGRVRTDTVAPFAGAWIEITVSADRRHTRGVAPFAGAWIEIF